MAAVGTQELRALLIHLYEMSHVRRYCPLLIWGEAGVGKSESVRSVADLLEIDFVDLRLGNMEAPDLMGLMRDDQVYPCLFDLQDPDSDPLVTGERWSRLGLWNHCKVKHPEKIPERLRDRPIEFVDWLVAQTERAGYGVYFENRTVYSAPSWFPEPDTSGILFLDELNRSQRDTRQGVFQLLLDRRIHELELPDGWIIASACNPPRASSDSDSGYDVDEITDRAFLDRFVHVVLSTTRDEWLEYARRRGVDPSIRTLIENDPSGAVLGLRRGTEIPLLEPTPRSWDILSQILAPAGRSELTGWLRRAVCEGKIGSRMGREYADWLDQLDSGEVAGDPSAATEVQLEAASDALASGDPSGAQVAAAAVGTALRQGDELSDLAATYANQWRSPALSSEISRILSAGGLPLAAAEGARWLRQRYSSGGAP